jgi:hypothetical protein
VFTTPIYHAIIVLEVPMTTAAPAQPQVEAPIPPDIRIFPMADLFVPDWNPRKTIIPWDLANLVAFMKAGKKPPRITVWKGDDKAPWAILEGQMRFLAAQQVGWTHMEAEVVDCTLEEAKDRAFTSNNQNKLLWFESDLAIAARYQELKAQGISQEALAGRLGKSQPKINNAIKIAKAFTPAAKELINQNLQKTLKNDNQTLIAKNKGFLITEYHLLALADLEDPAQVERALRVVLDEYLSEPKTKELVQWVKDGHDPELFGKHPAFAEAPADAEALAGTPAGRPGDSSKGVALREPQGVVDRIQTAEPTAPSESSDGGGGTPSHIQGPATEEKPKETKVTPVAPDPTGDPAKKAKTSGFGALVSRGFGALAKKFEKWAPKPVHVALKFLGRFLALPHHPCKYLANKMVPIGHSSGSHASHSHSGSGVSLLLLVRHWGLYLLMLPLAYVGVLALTGYLVGDLLPSTRAWFGNLTGYLFHLLLVQIPLGLAGQALHNPGAALILGGITLWLVYEFARPPRGVMILLAAVLAVAWFFRGWWMGLLHVSMPSSPFAQSEPAKSTPVTIVQAPPKASILPKDSLRSANRRTSSKVSIPTPNSSLQTPNYLPSQAWSESVEDKASLDSELAAIPQPCRILDFPVTVDSAMGEGMATGRLQDLADSDKYTLMQGHDKKQIQSVQVGATGLTLNLPGDALGNLAGNFLGVGSGPGKTAFFWEDVQAIHCNKAETVSEHPQVVYQCSVLATSLKKPFTVQCAGSESLEHLVSAMEFFIKSSQRGKAIPISSIPYINQGVRLDGDGTASVMWENSPMEKAGFLFGDRLWSLDTNTYGRQSRETLEAALQALAPGKHSLFVVTPKDWEKARRAEDFHSNASPIPQRRDYPLVVP